MLANKKGSLIGAVLAVSIGILVIHVNFVIFQGLYDAIVRDLSSYRFGDVRVTDEESYITKKSDVFLVNWFERIPYVEAAAPRLDSSASINATRNGKIIEQFKIPVVGVDPFLDPQVSTVSKTVVEGQYVLSRNSIVLGSSVVKKLGDVRLGDSVDIKVTNRHGEDKVKRLRITGIVQSPGGQGLDTSAIMHIDTLRDMLDRHKETGSIMVKLNDPKKALDVKNYFLRSFPNDDFEAQTIEESAEDALRGFRSGIAMINMIGLFGMMSSAFAVVTIQMMLVSSKTREVGVMRAIGAKRKDILIIFIVQGMMIGALGAGLGTAMGLGYTFYAKETKMTFAGSIPLQVSYDWGKIGQTAVMAFFLAVAASIYPSYKATKLQPVEAMRYV
ncbi:MAG TPA: ABC transporter permease [Candidatus Nitrosotenuis sp.]|jgi:lipoprotein-releasing system permease protein|nr:ABC transporter permease [Candidatus Nitrosotenuis sp.]